MWTVRPREAEKQEASPGRPECRPEWLPPWPWNVEGWGPSHEPRGLGLGLLKGVEAARGLSLRGYGFAIDLGHH